MDAAPVDWRTKALLSQVYTPPSVHITLPSQHKICTQESISEHDPMNR